MPWGRCMSLKRAPIPLLPFVSIFQFLIQNTHFFWAKRLRKTTGFQLCPSSPGSLHVQPSHKQPSQSSGHLAEWPVVCLATKLADAQSLTVDLSTDLSSLDQALAKNGQELKSFLTKILTLSTPHHKVDLVVEDNRAPYSFENHLYTHILETAPQDCPWGSTDRPSFPQWPNVCPTNPTALTHITKLPGHVNM